MAENSGVMLLLGTHKGVFLLSSDRDRKDWEVSGPHFKGWNGMHVVQDHRDGRIYTAVTHDVYGPTIHYTDDYGQTWTQAKENPAFARPSKSGRPVGTVAEMFSGEDVKEKPEKVSKIWNITPGRDEEPGVLYAGVAPAALFKSTDRGESWSVVEGLYDHPQRAKWNPGAGGLCLHTILPDPTNLNRMYVAISAGGFYRTDDGGNTWAPYNKNVRADFMPDPYPEFGHCVHKAAMHPSRPKVIFQQNHCGVYRTDNAGESWIDIGDGKLPSRFGFPIAVHPHDPQTVFVALEQSDEFRLSVDGRFAVWRSHDSGENWQKLTNGLPDQSHLVVYREAMATDTLDDAGIYIGTSTGQVFYSQDAGDTWSMLVDYLPPILSVETGFAQE